MKTTRLYPRTLALLLVLTLLAALVPAPTAAAAEMSGSCGKYGDNLTWSFADGVLTLSGSGEMADWEESAASPFYEFGGDVERVVLPEGMTTIGNYAFSVFHHMTEINIPDGITAIGKAAFIWCTVLPALSLPDSVTTIGRMAFAECSGLTEFSLPDGVTTIGDGAFYDCWRLTEFSIPDSVTAIGDFVFTGCGNIRFTVSPDNPHFAVTDGVLFSRDDGRLIRYPLTLQAESYAVPEGVRIIGPQAFRECESLTAVTFPDSLTTIADMAFYSCAGLRKLSLPESVTTIGDGAFGGCVSLTEIVIPDSVTAIGEDVFSLYADLTVIVGRGSGAEQYCRSHGLRYTVADGTD